MTRFFTATVTNTKSALLLFGLTLAWIGCAAVDAGEKQSSTSSNIERRGGRAGDLSTVKKAPASIPAAIDILPANGTVVDRQRTSSLSVKFSGFTPTASQTVEVQVLSSATASITETSWVTIATATTSSTPTTFSDDPAPIFRYDVEAVPGAGGEDRWPQGGLIRFRTVAVDADGKRTALPFYDATAGDCIAKQSTKSWKAILTACKSPFSPALGAALGGTARAAALVSPTPDPEDRFFPAYLSRKGFIEAEETDLYYDRVDAPRTLDEFEQRFGFFDRDSDEANGLYYNLGDLGLGREIHCKTFEDRDGEIGTACVTKNYGVFDDGVTPDFSGDAVSAMRDAVRGERSFAAVCMVKFGNKFAPPDGNDVQFFVYNAAGAIVNRAQLDSITSNDAIPNNCLNCHGGVYDRRTSSVVGASFLPYDPESFLFSNEEGFSYEEQEDEFRRLNVMVKNSGAPPGTAQFVDGLYDGRATVEGTKATFDWIPPGWSGSEEAKTVYRESYKPYCRTCHTSQVGEFAFLRYDDFKAANTKTTESVCGTNEMPVCEATMGNFWASPARAYIVNSLGLSTPCAPGTGGR